jgi:hypothetical protein
MRYMAIWPDGSQHNMTLYEIETELSDVLLPEDMKMLEDLKKTIPRHFQGRPRKNAQLLEVDTE